MAGLIVSIFSLGAALAIGAPPGQTATLPADPSLIRVFVHTVDPGESPTLAVLKQSAIDLTGAIASRKKTLALVDAEGKADLILEVLDRSLDVPKVVMGLAPQPGSPTSIAGMTGPVRVAVLRVKMTLGRESPVFTNKNKPAESARGWKSAADDIAAQIEKWAKSHQGEILKSRR